MSKKKRTDRVDLEGLQAVRQAERGYAIYMEVMNLMTKRFESLPDASRDGIMIMVLGILVEDIERRMGRDNLRSLVDSARDFRDSFGAKK